MYRSILLWPIFGIYSPSAWVFTVIIIIIFTKKPMMQIFCLTDTNRYNTTKYEVWRSLKCDTSFTSLNMYILLHPIWLTHQRMVYQVKISSPCTRTVRAYVAILFYSGLTQEISTMSSDYHLLDKNQDDNFSSKHARELVYVYIPLKKSNKT